MGVGGWNSTGNWVGGFSRLNETLTLFKTQRCKFCYPLYEKALYIFYLFKTGPSITVFKTHKFAFHAFQQRHTKSAKIIWLDGRKGEDLTLSLPSSKSIISQPFIEKCISDAMRFW